MDTFLYHDEDDEDANEFFWEPSSTCINKARFNGMFAMSNRECLYQIPVGWEEEHGYGDLPHGWNMNYYK